MPSILLCTGPEVHYKSPKTVSYWSETANFYYITA